MSKKRITPFEATHPGEMIKDELKEREELRNIYRQNIIGNLRASLDSITVRESGQDQ